MKRLRNILCLVLFVCLFSVVNVNAMSKEELKNKITKTYTINGATFKLSAAKIAQAENYLDNNDITESDMDYISNKIDEAVSMIEGYGVTNLNQLSNTQKNELKTLVTDVSNNTAVKATVVNGQITVYNIDGTEFGPINKEDVKYTSNNIAVTITGAIALIGISIAIIKAKKNA